MALGLVLLSCWPAHAGTAKACKPSLSQCPMKGCAKDATPNALSNILKHGQTLSGDPQTLTFEDFDALQNQLEQRFGGKYATLSKTQRMRLRNFKVSSGILGERDLVEIVGYIALKPGKSKPHANTGESVNCNLKGSDNNDFHISLTPQPNDTEFHGIVAEMIPQDRDAKWTAKRLQAVQQANLQVRVRGQLFLDNHHKVNQDENHPMGGQPKRFSLWEVHPVVAFDVCTAGSCGAESSSWQPLEDWNPPTSGGKEKDK
jgi:hypothetical protein